MARVRIRRVSPDVFVGSLTLGAPGCGGVGDTDGDGVIAVGAFGSSQADALHKAALIAERIANDPIISAILPPQARTAIIATKKLAGAAKRGSRFFRQMWKRYQGPGIKRVAKALHDEAMRAEGYSDVEVAGFWSAAKKVAKTATKYSAPGLIYRGGRAVVRKATRPKRRAPSEAPPEPQYDDAQWEPADDAPQYDGPADPDDAAPMREETPDDDTTDAPGGVVDDDADNGEKASA